MKPVFSCKIKSLNQQYAVGKAGLTQDKERYKSELEKARISDLLKSNEYAMGDVLEELSEPSQRLLRYLVKNGYLDENYHVYISNFYEGRLTRNDMDYLVAIWSFDKPKPSQKIDTPSEVCENMRDEDFGQAHALNVFIVDYLVEISSTKLYSVIDYISDHFDHAEEFLSSYFVLSKNVESFIEVLSSRWPGVVESSIGSNISYDVISRILRFCDPEHVNNYMNRDNILTKYVEENGADVFSATMLPEDKYIVLKYLDVKFQNLSSLKEYPSLLSYVYKESLYKITYNNIELIIDNYADFQKDGEIDLRGANYTAIRSSGCEYLNAYIEDNFKNYINNVLLVIPENINENKDSIISIIHNEKLEVEEIREILKKQRCVFGGFDGVSEDLWGVLVQAQSIGVSWENISACLKSEMVDNDLVMENILNNRESVDVLLESPISGSSIDEEQKKSLCGFLACADEIDDEDYCRLVRCLAYRYKAFPESVSESKKMCLAKAGKIALTERSFSQAENHCMLVSCLIESNFNEYRSNKDSYPIEDDVKEMLLSSELDREDKVSIVFDVSRSEASENGSLLVLMRQVVLGGEFDFGSCDSEVMQALIINADSIEEKLQLLLGCIPVRSEDWVMRVLSELDEPYSDIAEYGKRPKLEGSDINEELAHLLEGRGFVSSVRKDKGEIRINTKYGKGGPGS